MLKTGKQYLEGLRDGRVVYIGGEQVDDVTTHPAFRNAAQTIADFYDYKADPANRDTMAYTDEDGELVSMYYKKAKTREELQARSTAHQRLAEQSYGFLGRSPDYIASFVTGMALRPEYFEDRSDNLLSIYDHMRKNDTYAAHAIVSPQAVRDPKYYQQKGSESPCCRVVREEEDGVVVSGMKMLATGGILADEIWVGNILPLAPDALAESITFSMPVNTSGLSLWSRKPFEPNAKSEFDAPFTWRFDETDAMVMFDEVKVPWDRVVVHNDAEKSRGLYIETSAHAYGNHHSNVRFMVKLQLLVGLASRIAEANGAAKIPAVAETLGRLAAMEGMISGVVAGQIHAAEEFPVPGYLTFNRRMMYAGLNWGVENYSPIVDTVRELCGGGVLQMPADISLAKNPVMREQFQAFWSTPNSSAIDRMKLFKLAWDLVGSEFAGRHQQYEKFFPGASFIVRNHNHREAPWGQWHKMVDEILDRMEVPQELLAQAAE